MRAPICEVIKNQAFNKDFWYCREHKIECATGGCLEATPGVLSYDELHDVIESVILPMSLPKQMSWLNDWGYVYPPTDEDDFYV